MTTLSQSSYTNPEDSPVDGSPQASATDGRPVVPLTNPSANIDWFKAGFFASLGVAVLFVLAKVVQVLSVAALDIATPFIVGIVLALLLDPVVDRMEGRGLKRFVAVAIVFGVFLLVLVCIGIIAVPALIDQTTQLAHNAPDYVENAKTYVNNYLEHHRQIGTITLPRNFDDLSNQASARLSGVLSSSAGSVTTILLGSVSALLDIVITLIVTFYLLLDIDRLRARLFYLVPDKARKPMSLYAGDVGAVFSDYLRGLLIVSALYGACTLAMLLGLSLLHHDLARYAFLVAVVGGLLYTVPYIGPLATAVITFIVAFAAGGESGASFGGIAIVATLILNQIFDNVVTPRVVGSGVGLHPVASIFALTLGGALFGLPGLLLSVPVAASVQVILFRLFPKLTTPTPPAFLRAQGIKPEDAKSARILEGAQANVVEEATDEGVAQDVEVAEEKVATAEAIEEKKQVSSKK